MRGNEPTSGRRRFLGAVTAGLAAATAGCAVEVGEYEFDVGKSDDTPTPTDDAATATPTDDAATATPTDDAATTTETAADGTATSTDEETPTETPTDSPGGTDATPVSELSAGDLVINEVMIDPYSTSDEDGEWFEVYNAHSEPVDLEGLVVQDEVSNDQHTVSGSLVVQPGGYVVFVASQFGAEQAGFTADYVYDGVQLSDGSDDLLLTDGSVVIDQVSWSESTEGYSRTLDPRHQNAADNDDPTYWCDALVQLPGGDFGTPGEPNSRC